MLLISIHSNVLFYKSILFFLNSYYIYIIIAYACTIHRAVKKPFNPLLGETYENIREDKGFKFIAEKVSHHPPIMACYAESDDYIFFQDNNIKTKYWVCISLI